MNDGLELSLDLKHDSISGAFKSFDGDVVRDVDHADVVHLQNDVVDPETFVDRCSATYVGKIII